MPNISVDRLKPGMVLAKPLSKGSMVILGEGTELTEGWIARLSDMGVEQVFIDGPAEQPIPLEQALIELESRFRGVSDKPHMGEIKKIIKDHIEGLYAG